MQVALPTSEYWVVSSPKLTAMPDANPFYRFE